MANTAKTNLSTVVVTVDPFESVIGFSNMTDGNRASLTYETQKCKVKLFDEEFFQNFTKLVDGYVTQHPSFQTAGVTLVLPDRAVVTDVLSIPTLRRKQIDSSLSLAIKDLYKNSDDLKINRFVLTQNKQYTSFGLSMIQNSLLTSFNTALTTSKLVPQAITYASSSAVNTAISFNSKLGNATFMLMDIKEKYTNISFVVKGVNCGYYHLPFGYSILEHNRLAAEDMLFDHSQADLLVLNAKEKAKAKQLTMMSNDNSTQIAQEMLDEQEAIKQQELKNKSADNDEFSADYEDEYDYEDEKNEPDVFAANSTIQTGTVKTLPKKQPRKLPKFMLRPDPHGEEEYAYENFRIFVKWALNLVQINRKSIWQNKPEHIYVNMPKDYEYLFDMVNEEKKENGITFAPLELQGANDKITNNIESFGGFYSANYNLTNNF